MKKKIGKGIMLILALALAVNMGVLAVSAKEAALKKGSRFTKGNLVYEVTSVKGKKGTVKVVGAAKKGVKSVSVPKNVKSGKIALTVDEIGNSAFKNCKKLKKVTTSGALKTIGKNAFSGCKKLETLDLSASTKLASIGKNVLKGAGNAQVEIPETQDASYYEAKLGVTAERIVVPESRTADTGTGAEPQPEVQAAAPETAVPQPEVQTAPAAPETAEPQPEVQAAAPEMTAQEVQPAAPHPPFPRR